MSYFCETRRCLSILPNLQHLNAVLGSLFKSVHTQAPSPSRSVFMLLWNLHVGLPTKSVSYICWQKIFNAPLISQFDSLQNLFQLLAPPPPLLLLLLLLLAIVLLFPWNYPSLFHLPTFFSLSVSCQLFAVIC